MLAVPYCVTKDGKDKAITHAPLSSRIWIDLLLLEVHRRQFRVFQFKETCYRYGPYDPEIVWALE